jgi:hypothetical protein
MLSAAKHLSAHGETLRSGLKCTTPRLRYASLVASERKLTVTIESG